ncbi:hypothetical protein L2E82_51209 [Cichorium intybus]|nr:hypothetical protein L2E82_51209 [Cichorium intybus]
MTVAEADFRLGRRLLGGGAIGRSPLRSFHGRSSFSRIKSNPAAAIEIWPLAPLDHCHPETLGRTITHPSPSLQSAGAGQKSKKERLLARYGKMSYFSKAMNYQDQQINETLKKTHDFKGDPRSQLLLMHNDGSVTFSSSSMNLRLYPYKTTIEMRSKPSLAHLLVRPPTVNPLQIF